MFGYEPSMTSLFVNIVCFTPCALQTVRDVVFVYKSEHCRKVDMQSVLFSNEK